MKFPSVSALTKVIMDESDGESNKTVVKESGAFSASISEPLML
jgi:hypothetical protein